MHQSLQHECVFIYKVFACMLEDRIIICSVFNDCLPQMQNDTDMKHFSFVVNIVVVLVENSAKKI